MCTFSSRCSACVLNDCTLGGAKSLKEGVHTKEYLNSATGNQEFVAIRSKSCTWSQSASMMLTANFATLDRLDCRDSHVGALNPNPLRKTRLHIKFLERPGVLRVCCRDCCEWCFQVCCPLLGHMSGQWVWMKKSNRHDWIMSTPMQDIWEAAGMRALPSFISFKDGRKFDEVVNEYGKGWNEGELVGMLRSLVRSPKVWCQLAREITHIPRKKSYCFSSHDWDASFCKPPVLSKIEGEYWLPQGVCRLVLTPVIH